jgi:hypothetical protein
MLLRVSTCRPRKTLLQDMCQCIGSAELARQEDRRRAVVTKRQTMACRGPIAGSVAHDFNKVLMASVGLPSRWAARSPSSIL